MELALNELKTQAKKLQREFSDNSNISQKMRLSLKKIGITSVDDIKLKHCLSLVSSQLGFKDWRYAQEMLSGSNLSYNDWHMGDFFYPKGCDYFINEWFADYQLARNARMNQTKTKWLLPYRNQFIVVGEDYISMFKLKNALTLLWSDTQYDMVASYNTKGWDQIVCGIIKNRPKDF